MRRFFQGSRGDSPAKRLLIHIVLICACAVAVYPFLRVVSISLRPGSALLSTDLSLIPAGATFNNYKTLVMEKDFTIWLWNSILVSVATVMVGVLLAAAAAYAFSRWAFPGRRQGLLFLLTTQMLPPGMLLLPIYVMVVRLRLFNTYTGMILSYSAGSVPFSIWLLKGYYDTIPRELEEAAMVDGAGPITAFYRIIVPLSTPALAIAGLFSFMTAWSEFMMARVMLQKAAMFTWPLGFQKLMDQFSTQWNVFAAASVLVAIPAMLLFLYSSKWLISGLTLGGIKE
ncbi:MAG TPA: ABC transporter [Firmicutes bacterium]|jgi:arabinogalactan oligomer/maltooligosaccharide transport system permease protein|nr:ABC transporter [Bacillota bacterium]HBK59186.1 ABC transporter [Bacillota bacterium]